MIKVNGFLVDVSVDQILTKLREEFLLQGKDYFSRIRKSGDSYQTNCCFHKEGMEHKPSMGVLNKGNIKYPAGTAHCFTCGWTGNIFQIISFLYGRDEQEFGKQWLLDNFSSNRDPFYKEKKVRPSFFDEKSETKPFVTEEELQSYRRTHPYMYQRKLTDEVIKKFDIGYDEKTNCITFPVRDINKNTLFVTRRSVTNKFFDLGKDNIKTVYGIEYAYNTEDPVVICESQINALTCWTYGIPAVALLGTGNNIQYDQLNKFTTRTFILGFDGDDAGRKAIARFLEHVPDKINKIMKIPEGKDINDLSKDEFINLYNSAELVMWFDKDRKICYNFSDD